MTKQPGIDTQLLNKQYINLLDSPTTSEEDVHQFLVLHPMLLPLWGPYENLVFSKLRLGNQHAVDFAFARMDTPGITWHFIEIERPQDPLFTKKGDPSARLSHGIRQIQDWQNWFIENRDYIIRYFPFGDLMKQRGLWELESALIIGRRVSLTDRNRKLLQRLPPYRSKIMTFDHLADHVSAYDRNKSLRSARYVNARIETITEINF